VIATIKTHRVVGGEPGVSPAKEGLCELLRYEALAPSEAWERSKFSAETFRSDPARERSWHRDLLHLDNEFFKEKAEAFPVLRFFRELTQHILPKGCQYIRRYGLYASRTKGTWPDKPYVRRLDPAGCKKQQHQADLDIKPLDVGETDRPGVRGRPVDLQPMRILAVITEAEEVRKILRHLAKIGRSPPGFEPASLN
jgi:hypothetical protein